MSKKAGYVVSDMSNKKISKMTTYCFQRHDDELTSQLLRLVRHYVVDKGRMEEEKRRAKVLDQLWDGALDFYGL